MNETLCFHCNETIRFYPHVGEWCLVERDAIIRLWDAKKTLYVNVCVANEGGHAPKESDHG